LSKQTNCSRFLSNRISSSECHLRELELVLIVLLESLLCIGKTLLPVPAGAERVTDDIGNGHHENGNGAAVDSNLLHAIESVVIEWSHQVQDVLKKDSAQALLDGGSPLPSVEVEFWRSRYSNLQNIHEQVSSQSVSRGKFDNPFLVKRPTCEENGRTAAKNQF
jgi:hypothetical protein